MHPTTPVTKAGVRDGLPFRGAQLRVGPPRCRWRHYPISSVSDDLAGRRRASEVQPGVGRVVTSVASGSLLRRSDHPPEHGRQRRIESISTAKDKHGPRVWQLVTPVVSLIVDREGPGPFGLAGSGTRLPPKWIGQCWVIRFSPSRQHAWLAGEGVGRPSPG